MDRKQNDDMSMEDILASIRKYVSDEELKMSSSNGQGLEVSNQEEMIPDSIEVITLGQDHIIESNDIVEDKKPVYEAPRTYEEESTLSRNVVSDRKPGPFEKLSDAIKSYGKPPKKSESSEERTAKDVTMDQFLSAIAQKVVAEWVDKNLRKITEEIVIREIEKIKSE